MEPNLHVKMILMVETVMGSLIMDHLMNPPTVVPRKLKDRPTNPLINATAIKQQREIRTPTSARCK